MRKKAREKEINTCTVTEDNETMDYYLANMFKYKKAELYLRLSNESEIETIGKEKLPIKLVTGGQRWPLDNINVLGLSPQGYFAKYLRQLYEDSTSFLFGFSPIDNTADNDDLSFKTHVIQNPVFPKENLITKFFLGSDQSYWNLYGGFEVKGSDWHYTHTSICLSSVSNELILIPDSEMVCNFVIQRICPYMAYEDCTKAKAKLTQAPQLSLNTDTFIFTFNWDDYLFFDKQGIARCRLGNIADIRWRHICPPDTQVAVGKLFLAKYIPILTYNQDNSTEITFISKYPFYEDHDFPWHFLFGFCVFLMIAVIVFIIVKRNEEGDKIHSPYLTFH